MAGNYHLATTGISKIWDTDDKVLLLLGPWCKTDFANQKLLEGRELFEIPSPFKPAIILKEADDYCYSIYQKTIGILSEELNRIHEVNCPEKYWRILVGPWLLHFIGIFYERFQRIEKAIELYPDFSTNVLAINKCDIASADQLDFMAMQAPDDFYNLKLFSLIAHYLCPHNLNEIVLDEYDRIEKNEKKNDCLRLIKDWGKIVIERVVPETEKRCVVLCEMNHFSQYEQLSLQLDNRFPMIKFKHYSQFVRGDYKSDDQKREALVLGNAVGNFEWLLYKIIPKAIPICYFEAFATLRAEAVEQTQKTPKAVGSAVGWYFNEKWKYYAAEAAAKGAELLDFQHGGGYGVLLSVTSEKVSSDKDCFFTWGWNSNKMPNAKPLPSPHLSNLLNSYKKVTDDLLFVGTALPRYHHRFDTGLLCDDMLKYFDDRIEFICELADDIEKKILYRPVSECGWHEEELIKRTKPEVRFAYGGSLTRLMQTVAMVVIDHPQTSFLEALSINVPTILYWNEDVYLIEPEAKEYFQLLRDAGILFKDAKGAATKVNEVFGNPLEWWLNAEVQMARKRFCNRFALANKEWKDKWAKMMIDIAQTH